MKAPRNKTLDIYNYLLSEIEAGVYETGDLLPTDIQLAEKFSVSRPTAAKAVQRLQEEGIVIRKSGYGTCITRKNREDTTTAKYTLGLLIPSLGQTEIFEPICGEIAKLAGDNNFNLLWTGGAGSYGNELECARESAHSYVNQKVDGVFFAPLENIEHASVYNSEIVELLNKAGIPVVLLDRDIVETPQRSNCDLVSIDNIEAGFRVTMHLLDCSCRKIGFLTKNYTADTVHQRFIGARYAVERFKDPGSLTELNINESIRDFIAHNDLTQFDAIICYNDELAANFMQELDRIGIKVPEDLKVTGFDDVKYAKLLKTPLTTYRQPCRGLGRAAVDIMMKRIRRPDDEAYKIQIKGSLIIRESTGFIK